MFYLMVEGNSVGSCPCVGYTLHLCIPFLLLPHSSGYVSFTLHCNDFLPSPNHLKGEEGYFVSQLLRGTVFHGIAGREGMAAGIGS